MLHGWLSYLIDSWSHLLSMELDWRLKPAAARREGKARMNHNHVWGSGLVIQRYRRLRVLFRV